MRSYVENRGTVEFIRYSRCKHMGKISRIVQFVLDETTLVFDEVIEHKMSSNILLLADSHMNHFKHYL